MRPKSFVIIFITYVYTIDIPTIGSHRDNMCFVFTEFIVIVLDCTISFSLRWTMVKMAIYTQKCEQKWLKINNRGGVWNKNVLGGKNGKVNNPGRGAWGGRLFETREYMLQQPCCNKYFVASIVENTVIWIPWYVWWEKNMRRLAFMIKFPGRSSILCFHSSNISGKNFLIN